MKETISQWMGRRGLSTARTYRNLWGDKLSGKSFVLIHTMGKVASSSIVQSLRNSSVGNRIAIYHTHFLSKDGLAFLDELSARGFSGPKTLPTDVKTFLVRSHILSQQLPLLIRMGPRLKIVTIVRDAVATNLSGFFYNNNSWPAALRQASQLRQPKVFEQLAASFLATYPHHVPLTWFDMEIKNLFGIDVFARPFPYEQGYQILAGDHIDLLILKLDRLADCADAAFREFLGIPQFTLLRVNEAGDQWYAPLYREFTDWVAMPATYLEEMYSSQYSRHFFDDGEITDFRQKWQGDKSTPHGIHGSQGGKTVLKAVYPHEQLAVSETSAVDIS